MMHVKISQQTSAVINVVSLDVCTAMSELHIEIQASISGLHTEIHAGISGFRTQIDAISESRQSITT